MINKCASTEELKDYFKDKIVLVFGLSNFIDMGVVLDDKETLQ